MTDSDFTHAGLTVTVMADGVAIEADSAALYSWSNRAGHAWPCSTLEDLDSLRASFDTNGLLDIEHPGADDLDGSEFSAFACDAIAAVLPDSHPCYFVTVGQFKQCHCDAGHPEPCGSTCLNATVGD